MKGSIQLVLSALAVALVIGALVLWQRSTRAQPPHCACHDHPVPAASTPAVLDGASLYQIDATFTDEDDRDFALASLRGSPVLVAMFYASCTTVCPRIVSEAQRIEAALPDDERARLRVLFVTIDPADDTTSVLRDTARERNLPTPRWTLARTDEDTVRELAMALGVQYRRVGEREFVHSASITLLDREGRIATQLEGIDQPIDPIVSRAHELLGGEAR